MEREKIERIENVLDLFTGGGGSLQAHKILQQFGYNWQTACCVEWDSFAAGILRKRMLEGSTEAAPIWSDASTFDPEPWDGIVSGCVAGFPCQPFSTCGRREADEDKRNMWPDVARILRGIGSCKWALLENVGGLCSLDYFGEILSDLEAIGFDAIWQTRAASSVGANHRRARLWVYAWRNGSDT